MNFAMGDATHEHDLDEKTFASGDHLFHSRREIHEFCE